MKLVCNYSKELIELLDENKVQIDMIKLGLFDVSKDCFEIAKSYKPLMIHGVGRAERAGMRDIKSIDWQKVNYELAKYNVPHLGYHFISYSHEYDTKPTKAMIRERMISNTKLLKELVDVPLLIENIGFSGYYKHKGFLEYSINNEFITEVCELLDIGMILDTSHAKMCAKYYKIDPIEYMKGLPLHRVKEIHVNGTFTSEDGLRDKHLEMEEEDYKIVEWLIKNGDIKFLTLEYGGPSEHYANRSEKDALERQLKRLNKITNI